jgi:hypothetical protein
VQRSDDEEKSLQEWVGKQRRCHDNDKMRQDRKDLLDKIGFASKHNTSEAGQF